MKLEQANKFVDRVSNLVEKVSFVPYKHQFKKGSNSFSDKISLELRNVEKNLNVWIDLNINDDHEYIFVNLAYINSRAPHVVMNVESFLKDNNIKLYRMLYNDKHDINIFMNNFLNEFEAVLNSSLLPYFTGESQLVSTPIDFDWTA